MSKVDKCGHGGGEHLSYSERFYKLYNL